MHTTSEQNQPLTRSAVLAAVVAGHNTEDAVAAHLGVPADQSTRLWLLLNRLVCGGLVAMQVVDRAWHYRPTAAVLEADRGDLTPDQYGLARVVWDELARAVHDGEAGADFADVIDDLDASEADKRAVLAAIGGPA